MTDREDIELGDGPIEVERKPRSGVVVSVRLSAREADLLQEAAGKLRMTLSQVVRDAVARYLVLGPDSVPAGAPMTGTTSEESGRLVLSYNKQWKSAATSGGTVLEPTYTP